MLFLKYSLSTAFERRLSRAVMAFVIGSFVSVIVMIVMKNNNLRTSFYDLGQYVTIFYGFHNANITDYLFETHSQPFIAPVSIIYSVFPTPTALQFLGAVTICLGVYLCARFFTRAGLERWLGAAVFAASPCVWYLLLFDFHFEVFLFVLLPLFFYFSEVLPRDSKSDFKVVLLAALIAAVKEPYALLSMGLGIWIALRHKRLTVGAGIFFGSATYFLYATTTLIPEYTIQKNIGEIWSGGFGWLGRSPLEMAGTALGSPIETLKVMLTPVKLTYASLLLIPALVAVIYAPSFMIPSIPTLLISMLSENDNHVGIGHQYASATFLPLAIGCLIAAKKKSSRQSVQMLSTAVVLNLITLVAVGPSPLSRLFWSGKIWQYELAAYIPDGRAGVINKAINRYIPEDPSVVVSMQNSLQSGRLSNRNHAMAFPNGVFEPFSLPSVRTGGGFGRSLPRSEVWADYVLVDFKRPLFLKDRGCKWEWGACQDSELQSRFSEIVSALPEQYLLIYEYDGFMIFKRR